MTKQRIRVGGTEMDFTNQGTVRTAAHPFYGPANSRNLIAQIRGPEEEPTGLIEPTAPETVSFAHEYFDGGEPQARELTDLMKNRYMRAFTGILYDPGTKLITFTDRPVFNDGSVIDREHLIQRVRDGDFQHQAPLESAVGGSVSFEDVPKHRYLVAWAGGEEGAEKLAELASKHPAKAVYLWVPNVSDLTGPIARTAALFSYRGNRLDVDGSRGNCDYSCAFGERPASVEDASALRE